MTVTAVPRRVAYTADGINASFTTPFQFFELSVYVDGELKEVGTHYTITQELAGTAGSVVFLSPPPSGAEVLIAGATQHTQGSDYVENGAFPVEEMERSLDRLTMVVQELSEKLVYGPLPNEEAPVITATQPGSYVVIANDGHQYLIPASLFLAAGSDPTGIGLGHNVGDIVYHAFPSAPPGWIWLKDEVQWLPKADYPEYTARCAEAGFPYGETSTEVAVPAVGAFVRAWHPDNTADPDGGSRLEHDPDESDIVGNVIGSRQLNQNKAHTHTPGTLTGAVSGVTDGAGGHRHYTSRDGGHNVSDVSDNTATSASGFWSNESSYKLRGHTGNANVGLTNAVPNHAHYVSGTATITGATSSVGGGEARPDNVALPIIMLVRPGDNAARHCTLGVPYTFDDATAAGDPGDGLLRVNNASLPDVTEVYVSRVGAFAANYGQLFTALNVSGDDDNRGTVIIFAAGQLSNSAVFRVNGAVVNSGDWLTVPVEYIGGGGTSFADLAPLSVQITPHGAQGPAGINGDDGTVNDAVISNGELFGRRDDGVLDGIEIGTNLVLTGSVLSAVTGGVSDGDKGDITVSGGGATYTIDAGAVSTTKIADDAVTFAKLQDVAANSVLARVGGSSGDVSEVALAASRLLGRGSTGDVAAISLATNLELVGTELRGNKAPTLQKFTSSSTWNRPTGCRFVKATVVAAGAGGAGCPASSAGQVSYATGGGAGAVSVKYLDVTAISSVAVTIGAAGTGGAAGLNNGSAGGNSSFGTHAVANGGVGGTSVASGTSTQQTEGGAGGTASAGDIQIAGSSGGPFGRLTGTSAVGLAKGADGLYGTGGPWPGFNADGADASGFGAGGSGCSSANGGAARPGGDGTAGHITVEEFY